jgi:hypothetical protein
MILKSEDGPQGIAGAVSGREVEEWTAPRSGWRRIVKDGRVSRAGMRLLYRFVRVIGLVMIKVVMRLAAGFSIWQSMTRTSIAGSI